MLLKHSLKALILRDLTKAGELSFSELQQQLNATPGNLGAALQTLLRAKYVLMKPNSRFAIYRLSVKGNHAYSVYANQLK
jgi:DNA-binding HxlR family transcriptional regulator